MFGYLKVTKKQVICSWSFVQTFFEENLWIAFFALIKNRSKNYYHVVVVVFYCCYYYIKFRNKHEIQEKLNKKHIKIQRT